MLPPLVAPQVLGGLLLHEAQLRFVRVCVGKGFRIGRGLLSPSTDSSRAQPMSAPQHPHPTKNKSDKPAPTHFLHILCWADSLHSSAEILGYPPHTTLTSNVYQVPRQASTSAPAQSPAVMMSSCFMVSASWACAQKGETMVKVYVTVCVRGAASDIDCVCVRVRLCAHNCAHRQW